MDGRQDDAVISVRDKSESRRDLIRRGLKLGGAVYVAPVIVAAARPVSALAAVTNPNPQCAGQTCGNFTSCNNNSGCACASTLSGGGICANGQAACNSLQTCSAQTPCPSGYTCVINTCCETPICVLPCGTPYPVTTAAVGTGGPTVLHP